MFRSYVFHRDDLVPEFVTDADEWLIEGRGYMFKRGERVKNINRMEQVMYISKESRVGNNLVGFECYWWEE